MMGEACDSNLSCDLYAQGEISRDRSRVERLALAVRLGLATAAARRRLARRSVSRDRSQRRRPTPDDHHDGDEVLGDWSGSSLQPATTTDHQPRRLPVSHAPTRHAGLEVSVLVAWGREVASSNTPVRSTSWCVQQV
jgi:hypothetical protein